MSSTLRVSLCLLALILSFISPALAQSQSAPSAPAAQHSSDEAALRALAEALFRALAAKDLDGYLGLWSAKAPELEAHKKYMSDLFSRIERIEARDLTMRKIEVRGDRAVVRVSVEGRVIEANTGNERAGMYRRTLECMKEEGDWKVWRYASTIDELAAALAAAKSDQERAALLAEEKELVTAELARALGNQGFRFYDQGDYAQELAIRRLVLGIAEKIGAQPGIARALQEIGDVHYYQSYVAPALEYYQKSLALYESPGDKAGIADLLTRLGWTHYPLGNYTQALEHYQKGLALYESLGNKFGFAATLGHIGDVYRSQGNYAQALDHYQKSLALVEALEGKPAIAGMLNSIGVIHSRQGNYTQALEHYQKSFALSEELGSKGKMAMLLNNIGVVQRLQGNYAQALDYFQKSLALSEAIKYKHKIADALNNIGVVQRLQGNYAQALDYFQKSLALSEKVEGKEEITQTLKNIADVHLSQGNYAQALEIAERAASVSRAIGASEMLQESLTTVSSAYRQLNKPVEARQALEEAIRVIETMRVQVAGGAVEQQRFFAFNVSPYHAMATLLTREGRPAEALTIAERAKARVLLDVLQTGRVKVTKAMTGQEQEQESKLRSELISLNIQVTRASQQERPDQARLDELKSLREKARLNYEAFQISLYAAHPELRTQRGEAPVIKAEELAALLPDEHSALLEYVVNEQETYLFTVSKAAGKPAAEVQVFTLPVKQAELAKQIESFRRQLAGRDLGFRASARRLYQLLLKPAQAQLQGKTNLVIVPDYKLWDLPFQALLTEGDRYIIERSAVSYIPSLTVLREMKAKRNRRQAEPAGPALLALGNPALGKETIERAALTLRDEKLDPLPEAELEVKALRRLYGMSRSKVYIGAEAREDRVKSEAGQAKILHFATHGTMNNASPMYSHLVLAQGDKNEDGLLEAWELMQLDLKADLAVLSACETARGRFGAGEGMIGLTWALFVAGAPSTVVSQWKIESASTRDLMLGFHRHLRSPAAAKPTKAEALRQSALRLMKIPETSHPFYWAGFVLVGDGR